MEFTKPKDGWQTVSRNGQELGKVRKVQPDFTKGLPGYLTTRWAAKKPDGTEVGGFPTRQAAAAWL